MKAGKGVGPIRQTLATSAALAALAGPATTASETRTVTDDRGRAVGFASDPRRVATTESASLAVLLIEPGLPPVASAGMMFDGATLTRRAGAVTTGVDFATLGISPFDLRSLDLEAMVALVPDLILPSAQFARYTDADPDRLSRIAPVVAVDTAAC